MKQNKVIKERISKSDPDDISGSLIFSLFIVLVILVLFLILLLNLISKPFNNFCLEKNMHYYGSNSKSYCVDSNNTAHEFILDCSSYPIKPCKEIKLAK